jgi:hypothetical protein
LEGEPKRGRENLVTTWYQNTEGVGAVSSISTAHSLRYVQPQNWIIGWLDSKPLVKRNFLGFREARLLMTLRKSCMRRGFECSHALIRIGAFHFTTLRKERSKMGISQTLQELEEQLQTNSVRQNAAAVSSMLTEEFREYGNCFSRSVL